MRKKYLSALLFGALLVTSAGTFTSCKDYDDDINNLQEQITANADAIKALQDKIGDGKFVTNIASESNGLKITWNDDSSTVIENVINGEDQKGDVVSIDPETGEIKINNEGTGFYASKGEGETSEEVKLPYVNEEGVLVIFDENGEEVVTGIRVSPVTAIVYEDGSADITIIAADGTKQTVKVPSAASMISNLELVGYADAEGAKENGFVPMSVGFVEWSSYRVEGDGMKDWKGNKPALKDNDITFAYDTKGLVVRIPNSNIDAKDLNLSLVNSKDEAAPLTVSLSNYDELITRSASSNGMYNVAFDYTVFNSDAATPGTDIYGGASNQNYVLFGLKAQNGLVSKYEIVLKKNQHDIAVSNAYLNEEKGENKLSNSTASSIELNKSYDIVLADKEYVYDAYLEFTEQQALEWGVKYDKTESPMSFTVTKMPDTQTPADLKITVHYATLKGETGKLENLLVKPTTNMSDVQLCDLIKHNIVLNEENNNAQVVSLDKMVEALGTEGYITWKADVDLNATLQQSNGTKYDNITIVTNDGKSTPIADTYTVEFLKADGKTATNASEAKSLRVKFMNTAAIDLTKQYIAKVEFAASTSGKYYNDVVNTVNFPIEFSIPAFTDLLQKDMNVFDAEGKVASAYLVEPYEGSNATFKLKGAFVNFEENINKGFKFTLTLDNQTNIVGNSKSSDLAHLTAKVDGSDGWNATEAITADNASTASITLAGTTKDEAYGKELILKVSNATYCNVYEYDETSFKMKLMSAIKEGKVVANGDAIKISRTATTVITAEDIWATTVNSDIVYSIFKTAVKNSSTGTYESGWERNDIASVKFETEGIKFTIEGDGTPSDVTFEADGVTVKTPSSIKLNASSNSGEGVLVVTVTDVWGFKLTQKVRVIVE